MGWPASTSRAWLAIAAGIGVALVAPLVATFYWDVRCRGADDACALGYLVWLERSLLGGPILGSGVAALLARPERRPRAALVALGVTAALLWTLLGWSRWWRS